eukprot:CAMPEP_0119108448 /NCGR_PEP_ID=MMETSP1180-20130426/14437_1 /TAXON_ID=3052 ORGANISM="Chlamydomonas cf sp, Strain CCMP681" /NCGR_SAMPLE_ID=MMETSP1180 /ASSEMBLY_ACC=CAM_ASM_000741 /LENGTH=165 /DNA_ID=CAMNT_0007094059 /DNA_START=57 /DNA_END=555 /DNA_ORIENTATION=-
MANGSNAVYTITFTTGLIEKLAGVRRLTPPQTHAPEPRPLMMHPEILALKQKDAQLAKALTSSKRVGHLLVKAEEEESLKIQQLGQELLQQYRFDPRPVPCQQERDDAWSATAATHRAPGGAKLWWMHTRSVPARPSQGWGPSRDDERVHLVAPDVEAGIDLGNG